MTTAFRFKRRVLGLAAGAVILSLIAACGGDKNDNESSSSSGENTPVSTSQSAGAPSAGTPAAGATSATSASSSGFSSLNSYKYRLVFSGTGGVVEEILSNFQGATTAEFSGAFIKPDKAQASIKGGSFEAVATVIGNQQWQSFNGVVQGPLPATAQDIEDANIIDAFWQSSFQDNMKSFKCGGKENTNGVSAIKCTLDKAGFEALLNQSDSFVPGLKGSTLSQAEAQVWLADEGYPVRMRMQGAGKDAANKDFDFKVEMDVTDINGSFQITAPKT